MSLRVLDLTPAMDHSVRAWKSYRVALAANLDRRPDSFVEFVDRPDRYRGGG